MSASLVHSHSLSKVRVQCCLQAALTLLVAGEVGCQTPDFAAQYHIQTDLGAGRNFRFQTHTGQYRKEVLHPDGTQEGTYGWVDPNGVLRLFDYIADSAGYRIVKESLFQVSHRVIMTDY